MPSFTFVSTANAFVLRGAVPVFVDIRPDTLNIDENLIEAAITPRTRAICAVHYAGVGCEMDAIMAIAARHGSRVIEDAAQGILAAYRGKPLGSIGDARRAELPRDEEHHLRRRRRAARQRPALRRARRDHPREGHQPQRSSSAARSTSTPGSTSARRTCRARSSRRSSPRSSKRRMRSPRAALALWNRYHEAFAALEAAGRLRRPIVPAHCTSQRAHVLPAAATISIRARASSPRSARRTSIRSSTTCRCTAAPAGRKYGRAAGGLDITDRTSERLVRLPLWLPDLDQARVIDAVQGFFA